MMPVHEAARFIVAGFVVLAVCVYVFGVWTTALALALVGMLAKLKWFRR